MSRVLPDKHDHENFDTQQPDDGRPRRLMVRQDRICPDPGTCFLHLKNVKYEVVNYTPFGIAVEAPEFMERGQEFLEAIVSFEGFEIGRYHLKAVRQSEAGDNRVLVGFEILGEPLDTAKISGVQIGLSLAESTTTELQKWMNIPDSFKARVNEMRDVLESLRAECDRVEEHLNWETSEVYKLRETAGAVVGRVLSENFGKMMAALGEEVSQAPKETKSACFSFFRTKLQSLIYRSPLANRAFRKPLGYAGDFQMMNIMYDKQSVGDSLFSKCVHEYFIDAPASKAVRNRALYLKTKIQEVIAAAKKNGRVAKFISVASGPARELGLVFSESSAAETPVEIHLLDQDITALQDAQRRLLSLKKKHKAKFEVRLHNLAIKNVIARGLPEDEFDLVYSAGLFDYFSDSVATIAAQRLFAACRNDGQMIIGNFNTDNPSQIVMELALDWHLIYRSEEQLKRLFSPVGAKLTIEREDENINLFCLFRKA